ncbi:MAG: glycosyltransferase family 2 protein, partial [Eubacteriales bacterium]|nr:glycosyltransferase family 2 protein [Eubacteriales bacterium]
MPVVIIPTYKPDETLVTITDQLWGYGCRIVVVDDGSDEEYQAVFDKISDICIILRHSENRGKGAAIKTALTYVKEELWDGNVIGVMDCDGQHLPEDMMKLFTFAKTHRKTMVLGVREVGKD